MEEAAGEALMDPPPDVGDAITVDDGSAEEVAESDCDAKLDTDVKSESVPKRESTLLNDAEREPPALREDATEQEGLDAVVSDSEALLLTDWDSEGRGDADALADGVGTTEIDCVWETSGLVVGESDEANENEEAPDAERVAIVAVAPPEDVLALEGDISAEGDTLGVECDALAAPDDDEPVETDATLDTDKEPDALLLLKDERLAAPDEEADAWGVTDREALVERDAETERVELIVAAEEKLVEEVPENDACDVRDGETEDVAVRDAIEEAHTVALV